MAAYAILEKEGAEIGKADYVPHMFAYLGGGGGVSDGFSDEGDEIYINAKS